MEKMKGGFDLDYSNGICFDDNDFIKRLIVNNFEFKTNTFSESEPYVIHLFHEKSNSLIYNKEEKWNINKKIYHEKCKNMNITNDWKLCNFMPNPVLCDNKKANYTDINFVIGIILNKKSEIKKIENNIINIINEDAVYLSNVIKNINLNIIFCVEDKNKLIENFINFWEKKFIYTKFKNQYSKKIYFIDYSNDMEINIHKIYKFKNDLTLKLFYNNENNFVVIPNNLLKELPILEKNYEITKNTNLLELQNKFLEFNNININIIFDKKNFTNEMNTFRKCILKGYFYKNSQIKIPSTIKIKILYEN